MGLWNRKTVLSRWSVRGEQDFDLLIIDMIMPEKGGLETILQVRKKWPTVRILGISGAIRENSRSILDRARKAGAHGVTPKPFNKEELLAAVREILPASK